MDLPYNNQPVFTHWVARNGYLRSPFVLVDVGVLGGISVRWQHIGDGLEVHGFDPLEEAIAPLRAEARPGHHYYAIALGDEDCERELFVPPVLPGSSFFPRDLVGDHTRMVIDPRNWQHTQRRRVQMNKLDTLMAQGVVTRADFIKIDCEGFEPAVLTGAREFLSHCGALSIECEIGFSSNRWAQTHFLAVYEQLLPHGFRLSNLAFDRVPFASYVERARALGIASPATVSRPGTFNILFSRDPGNSPDAVLKAAIILEIYGMADSAYDLLDRSLRLFDPALPLRDGMDLLIAA